MRPNIHKFLRNTCVIAAHPSGELTSKVAAATTVTHAITVMNKILPGRSEEAARCVTTV